MASLISHTDAASLASAVYEIQSDTFTPATIDRFKSNWDLSNESSVVNGLSGTLWVIKKETGFGVVAEGRGDFAGDILILLRGTDNNFDWATDATVGFSPSATGRFVHTGFNACFHTILPELKNQLNVIKQRFQAANKTVRTIHCVGHSLGGALATLTAEWLNKSKHLHYTDVKLYTFGSPRVGGIRFVKLVTEEMDKGKDIYRVYHKTDVVPMVPLWPFYHLPESKAGYCLKSPGSMPSGEFHKMKNYIASVSKTSSWETMYELEPEVSQSAIEQWLSSDGPLSLTMNTMNMINKAIAYVLQKILKVAGISLQLGIASGVTLLDMLAYVLKKGIDFSKKLSTWVYKLIKRIMVALGMKIKKDINFTTSFIRHIFKQLKDKIDRLVQIAVHSIFDH
ncbi:lipase family protein [Microbulbifer sp. CAU 1566]|uniref:lipase family protein n=1 Tax=Microbulbifer sp. CAU 1566 TaxID=2933269 RepID=UPI0020039D89|nr:lipase family protein [Microbulbifer sp. CAU 1566]MCK7598882.1 lipase family protein [Microbulbifer sp. CAU 1566]